MLALLLENFCWRAGRRALARPAEAGWIVSSEPVIEHYIYSCASLTILEPVCWICIIRDYTKRVRQQRRLSHLLFINVIMILGLVGVGLFSNSLSVLAAGGDFVVDSLAIALGLFAVHRRDTQGDEKATTYVALINAGMLTGITLYVIVQAVHRLLTHSPEIHALPVFIVAALSAIAMGLGVFILGKGAGNEDLHMRSVLLDTASDGLSAVGVAIVGVVILLTHKYYWLDSVAAIIISLIVGYSAIRLLEQVVSSLTTGNPLEIDND